MGRQLVVGTDVASSSTEFKKVVPQVRILSRGTGQTVKVNSLDSSSQESGHANQKQFINDKLSVKEGLTLSSEPKQETRGDTSSLLLMSSERQRTVLLQFLDEQYVQEADDLAPTTLIPIELYAAYLSKHQPEKHWNLNSVRSFLTKLNKRKVEYQGEPCIVSVTYHVSVMIDGCELHVPAAVYDSRQFSQRVILGKDAFKILSIGEVNCVESEVMITLDQNCGTEAEFQTSDGTYFTKILLDTGAGPSVMSVQMWEKLNHNVLLHGDHTSLMAANGQKMAIAGRTPPLNFKLGETQVVMSFLVSRNLGVREVILGRNFMFSYDVLVDLSKGTACIRNAHGKYVRKRIVKMYDEGKRTYARCIEDKTIPPSSVVSNCLQLREGCSAEQWEGRQVAVLPRIMPGTKLIPARTVTSVRNAQVWAPLLNVHDKELSSTDTEQYLAQVVPVRTHYEKFEVFPENDCSS